MDVITLISSISPIAAILIVFGIGFVILEMFHPGLSVPGIFGGILLIIGFVLSAKSIMDVIILLILVLAILGIALTFVIHSATRGRLSKVIILSDSLNKEDDNAALGDLDYFLEKEGLTLTPLRPAGCADFNGVRLDVVSEGEFIKKDSKVKIIKVAGRRIVVKEVK